MLFDLNRAYREFNRDLRFDRKEDMFNKLVGIGQDDVNFKALVDCAIGAFSLVMSSHSGGKTWNFDQALRKAMERVTDELKSTVDYCVKQNKPFPRYSNDDYLEELMQWDYGANPSPGSFSQETIKTTRALYPKVTKKLTPKLAQQACVEGWKIFREKCKQKVPELQRKYEEFQRNAR